MFVCICNQVTEAQIEYAAERGVSRIETLSAQLKVGTCCGKCIDCATEVLNKAVQKNARQQAVPIPNFSSMTLA